MSVNLYLSGILSQPKWLIPSVSHLCLSAVTVLSQPSFYLKTSCTYNYCLLPCLRVCNAAHSLKLTISRIIHVFCQAVTIIYFGYWKLGQILQSHFLLWNELHSAATKSKYVLLFWM